MATTPNALPHEPATAGQVAGEAPLGESAEQKYQRLYATPSVSAPAFPPEVLSTLQSMQSELTALKQGQTPQPYPTTSSKQEWVDKIRSGDFDGALDSITRHTEAAMEPKLEQVRQKAYQDALSAAQVNVEVDRYLQTIRSANPDIIPFERYLQGPVTERIQTAQAARRINTPADFLREYRAAVDAEVVNLRNLGLQFRAAGKDEALTRTSEVSRSTALTPQQVQSTQDTPSSPGTVQGESTDDYFARRKQDENRRRGLG